jgi:hypothetical protein
MYLMHLLEMHDMGCMLSEHVERESRGIWAPCISIVQNDTVKVHVGKGRKLFRLPL